MSVRRIVSLFNGQDYLNGETNGDSGGEVDDAANTTSDDSDEAPNGYHEESYLSEESQITPIKTLLSINGEIPGPHVNGKSNHRTANGYSTTNGFGHSETWIQDIDSTLKKNGGPSPVPSGKEEDLYTRPSSLPKPVIGSASNSQRRRVPSSTLSIKNPMPQKPPRIDERVTFTRSDAGSPELASKIPRPTGTLRQNPPDSTPTTFRSTSNATTLPGYSPPRATPWIYHESKLSPPPLPSRFNLQANLYADEKANGIGTEEPQQGSVSPPEELPDHEPQGKAIGPTPWTGVDRFSLHSRTSITHHLPKLITDFPRILATQPADNTAGSASSADRIRDLEVEVSRLRSVRDDLRSKLTQTKLEQYVKDEVSALSPTAGIDRLHEYLEPQTIYSPTQKVSPIKISPTIRAKKIVLILDATNSGTVRPMAMKLRDRTQIPRTVLKRISDCLTAEHKETQMRQQVFYLSGCGSGEEFGLNKSLHTTILDSYTYLSDNWTPGDELFLFGFSRGAFAIRAIAALITEIGLLNKAGMAHFETLYDTYFDPRYGKCRSTDDYEEWRDRCTALAWELTQKEGVTVTKVSVKFLGCLDTIGWSNYETSPEKSINNAQKLWEKGTFDFRHLLLHEAIESAFQALALDEDRNSHAPLLMFRPKDSMKRLIQVWFTGSHINIGGGQLTHEIGKNLAVTTPDQNELSDIVFLFLITECHEFLSFSKKHVNRGVSDYITRQSKAQILNDILFKYHWVSARVDEPWSEVPSFKVFTRIRNAAGYRKRHVRTPLRYRPHWFDWEPWSRYTSGEAIHVSCQYRMRHYPEYVPKALEGYRCARTFQKFGQRRDPSESVPGDVSVLRYSGPKTGDEQYYYAGEESTKNRMFHKNLSLPIIKLSAFEVLFSGGDSLIFGFGIAYKDIYRESPPVYRYSLDELTSMQEDWIMRVQVQAPRPSSPRSMSDRTIALRNARSLPSNLRYQNRRINPEIYYNTENTHGSSDIRPRPVTAETEVPDMQCRPPMPTRPPPSPPRAISPTTPSRNDGEDYHRLPFPGEEGIQNKSEWAKGKGRHSRHSNYLEKQSRTVGSKGMNSGQDFEPEANPRPEEKKSKTEGIKKMFSFANSQKKKAALKPSNSTLKV